MKKKLTEDWFAMYVGLVLVALILPNTAINCDSGAVLSMTPRFTVFDAAEYTTTLINVNAGVLHAGTLASDTELFVNKKGDRFKNLSPFSFQAGCPSVGCLRSVKMSVCPYFWLFLARGTVGQPGPCHPERMARDGPIERPPAAWPSRPSARPLASLRITGDAVEVALTSVTALAENTFN